MSEKSYDKIMRVMKHATKSLADLVDIMQGPEIYENELTEDEIRKFELQLFKLTLVMRRMAETVKGCDKDESTEK